MEYQVPQFIGAEDKIIGPLTLKQFIYLAGGAGLCVVFFSYLPLIVAVLLSLPVAGFAAALAFYKINGKPFIEMVEAGFNYYIRAKLFLWKHKDQQVTKKEVIIDRISRNTPKLTRGKLSELAWSLDVQSLSKKPPSAI
ncbi:PrgI family protein, partial [Candidatus Kaiserbacteria bacterium]|nr:PrgI family protein [Candidatus Kaiserbacteria bacterium]